MDIANRTITQYYAYCSRCGAYGPTENTSQSAALAAFDLGWKEVDAGKDRTFFYRTFCPLCHARHEQEQ